MMNRTFSRDRFTWLAYLFLAFYGYLLNALGPVTPFLKDELGFVIVQLAGRAPRVGL